MAQPYKRPSIGGIPLQKKYGQHFLKDESVVTCMLDAVTLTSTSSVFEIGCGNGFLTRAILQHPLARLWVFEIDEAWAAHVREQLPDERMTMFLTDILTVDMSTMEPHRPWILLANLPYQITFPLLYKLHEQRSLLQEGVVMIQEEVAQKLVASSGRGYGFTSLFFQHYFTLKLLVKIPPHAFYPAPKVTSRLLYFKPRFDQPTIPDEDEFWTFIKKCFASPRRTLRNNLIASPYHLLVPTTPWDALRAQQMSIKDLLALWDMIRTAQQLQKAS